MNGLIGRGANGIAELIAQAATRPGPLMVEFGTIRLARETLWLEPDSMPGVTIGSRDIQPGGYMVSWHLSNEVSAKALIATDLEHNHVLRPLAEGDRVLIGWVGGVPVIADVVLPSVADASDPGLAAIPTVTGLKQDAVAGSLVAALATLGLITDNTT